MSDFKPDQHPRGNNGEFVVAPKDADTVGDLPVAPYPTIWFSDMDRIMVDGDGLEGLVCVCGNDATLSGFGWGDAVGKFIGGPYAEPVTSICHSCGRVYLDEDFDEENEGTEARPIVRFDPYADEFQDAQATYWVVNDFMTAEDAGKLQRRVRPAGE